MAFPLLPIVRPTAKSDQQSKLIMQTKQPVHTDLHKSKTVSRVYTPAHLGQERKSRYRVYRRFVYTVYTGIGTKNPG